MSRRRKCLNSVTFSVDLLSFLCWWTIVLPDPEGTPSSEPPRLASLGSLLDDQHWHHLLMVWSSSHLNLTVDKHTETLQLPAELGRRTSSLEVGIARRLQMNPADEDPN